LALIIKVRSQVLGFRFQIPGLKKTLASTSLRFS